MEPRGLANAPLEREWHPRTGLDVLACIQEAVGRLTEIAAGSVDELQVDLVKAAQDLSMLLRKDDARVGDVRERRRRVGLR